MNGISGPLNNDALRPTTDSPVGVATARPTGDPQSDAVVAEATALLNRVGLRRRVEGGVAAVDTARINGTGPADPAVTQYVNGAQARAVAPPSPPAIQLTPQLQQGAESFAHNIDAAVPSSVSQLAGASPDVLVALFLKLNITDPNKSVDTFDNLSQMATALQKLATADESAQANETTQGVDQSIDRNDDASDSSGLSAEQARRLAAMLKQNSKDKSKLLQTIIESKSQVVQAVLGMMQALMASNATLTSTGAAR